MVIQRDVHLFCMKFAFEKCPENLFIFDNHRKMKRKEKMEIRTHLIKKIRISL